MHEVKTIYLLYVNGTGYMYCDSPDNIDYILSRFRKTENNNILNLYEFKIEVNKILNHSYEYFIFNFDKNILNDISKKVNIIKNDAKPSFREYLGKINNNELVLVIATDSMTYYNHKELENLLSIYSIYDYKKQEEAKIFIKELNKYYYMEGNYYPHKFIFNKTCKEELKCKYCDEKNTLFNYRSHLIPHSIYNNKYFDAQECISCNQRFGNGIENNSLHFFQQLFKKNINMDSYNINMQDIYRLLVKMSMGFLDISETSLYFKNTIKWINNDIKCCKLPPLLLFIDEDKNEIFDESELITYFRKNNNDKNLPFMYSEYHIKEYCFIYIIPMFLDDGNEKDFYVKNNFDNFLKILPQLKYKTPQNIYCNNDKIEYININNLLQLK